MKPFTRSIVSAWGDYSPFDPQQPPASHYSFSHLLSPGPFPGKKGLHHPGSLACSLQFGASQLEEVSRKQKGGRKREKGEFPSSSAHSSGSNPVLPLWNSTWWPFLHCCSDPVCSPCPWSPERLMLSLCFCSLSALTSHFCFLNSAQISVSSPFIKIYSLKAAVLSSSCTLSSPRELLKTTNAWAPIPRDWCNRPGLGPGRSCCLRALQVMTPELRTVYWNHVSEFCFQPRL